MTETKIVESASETIRLTKQIYMRTILLIISWLILGLCGEIIGPTMEILAHNIHVTFNGIASVLASASAGGLITNIFFGIFQNLINNYSDLMLAIVFFLSALLMSVTPFINSLIPMCIVFFFQGASGSSAGMGGTNLLIEMWDTRVAVPLNMVHLGYGFGAIFANLLVRPFLSNKDSYVNGSESCQYNSTSSLSICSPLNSNIQVPYLISGSLCFLISIGHLIFFIQNKINKSNKAEMEQVNYASVKTNCSKSEPDSDEIKLPRYSPKTCGNGYFGYGLTLSLIFILYIFFVSGTDQTFAKFYFSFLKFDHFGISANGASWGIILYWFSFSVGRLICAILSVFIPVHICLTVTWCGGLVLAIIWMIYVWIIGLTATSLFVLGSLTGLIIAPLFPLSFAWITQKLNVIPALLAALLCGCGLGSLILQKIAGIVMDRNHNHFPTLLTGCIIVTIILYIISNIIIFFHERNLKTRRDSLIDNEQATTAKLNEEDEEELEMANSLQDINKARKNSILLSF